jgi:hypothetical protein
MFCAPGLVFQRCRVHRGPFSCFALPDSFLAVPRASVLVFMFCAFGLIFGGTEGVRSHFHVLRAQNRLLRYRGRRVPFSCFALPDSFLVGSSASFPVFMFCATRIVFGCTEGVRSCFHILRAGTRFLRYRGRQFSFLFFALPDSFSTVSGASGTVFIFCAPRLVVGVAECVGSRFHVLCSRTRFRMCRVRQVPF